MVECASVRALLLENSELLAAEGRPTVGEGTACVPSVESGRSPKRVWSTRDDLLKKNGILNSLFIIRLTPSCL